MARRRRESPEAFDIPPAAHGFVLCGRCGVDVKDGERWFKAHDKVCGLPKPEARAREREEESRPPEPPPMPQAPVDESPAARALREKMLKYAAKFSVDLMGSLKPRD